MLNSQDPAVRIAVPHLPNMCILGEVLRTLETQSTPCGVLITDGFVCFESRGVRLIAA